MKSIYKYIVCVCTALAATSCDFLDVVPDNVATEEHAFADRYTVEKNIWLLVIGECRRPPIGMRTRVFMVLWKWF